MPGRRSHRGRELGPQAACAVPSKGGKATASAVPRPTQGRPQQRWREESDAPCGTSGADSTQRTSELRAALNARNRCPQQPDPSAGAVHLSERPAQVPPSRQSMVATASEPAELSKAVGNSRSNCAHGSGDASDSSPSKGLKPQGPGRAKPAENPRRHDPDSGTCCGRLQ